MNGKTSLSMKAVHIVYGDQPIVVQCVPRQVVKGKVFIKARPDSKGAFVPPGTPEHEVFSSLKNEVAGYTSNSVISVSNRRISSCVSMSAEQVITILASSIS